MVNVDRMHIENFRSVKNLDVKLDKINALIGPNNAGKSNVMKALSIVLGESWPSSKIVDDNDYFDRDRRKPIKIQVMFDQHFVDSRYGMKVYGFGFECQNDDVNFLALDSSGDPLKYSKGTPVRVSQEMKDEVSLVFVDIDRQSTQQIRATQWTLYGKILKFLGSKIPENNKAQFLKAVISAFNSEIFNISPGSDLRYLEEQLKNSVKDHTGFDLTLELSILDPVEAIKNVRPYFKEGTNPSKYDPEEMGAGTQSALSVSIARAYSEIVKKSVILAIEEPELHFHPQACRNFYNRLRLLSESGLQVIYSTHSPYFVDVSKFESLHVVRKKNSTTTIESGLTLLSTGSQQNRIITKFNEGVNQALFADSAVLVEGPDDEIACKAMFEKQGFDLYKNNVSVVSCGGLPNIPTIARVLNALKIDTIALVDEDPGNSNTASIIEKLKGILGDDMVYLQSPNLEGIFGMSSKFNQASALTFFQNYQNGVPQVYSDLTTRLSP
ncbi:ATP-dependent nuclease [Candidatus Mancarchaeum acidiphilum]|uniref:ATP-dependent nuclease n=1 Tax=Candidatus Mancarchaeum acidiphilum TaxID=1920749 RepID=UPI0012FF80DA|nr:AAA family ATPase [Candidatus Mancarchaeum acidiphilum]